MKKILYVIAVLSLILFSGQCCGYALEEYRYDFEDGDQGWKIPDWAFYQKDHKALTSEVSTDVASTGTHSYKVDCDFPGNVWTAALVEVEKDYDLYGYDSISVDVYIPRNAPRDLMQARIILTVGDGWLFAEQRTPAPLTPGKWTTVTAKLESSEVPDSAWKGRGEKRLFNYIHKIKKIAVRAEYDASPPTRLGPRYNGPFYIDNLRIKPGNPADYPPPAPPQAQAAKGAAEPSGK